jgi:hypothetical protein
MDSFKQWGVIGDWDNPYFTYNPQYEVEQLEVFLQMYEKVILIAIFFYIFLCHLNLYHKVFGAFIVLVYLFRFRQL